MFYIMRLDDTRVVLDDQVKEVSINSGKCNVWTEDDANDMCDMLNQLYGDTYIVAKWCKDPPKRSNILMDLFNLVNKVSKHG